MKKFLLSVSFTLIVAASFAQPIWGIDFDCQTNLNRISIDTFSNPNCIWQIGEPAKTVFTTTHSVPHVIVTDKLNPVPANDTSIFYLKHVTSPIPLHHLSMSFWYQMDGDSTDRGIIEVSPDSAHTIWINLLTQDTTYYFHWITTKPSLTGSTIGWQNFQVTLMEAYANMGGYLLTDTLLFRFTYITDSISTPHDGWMIDDFIIEDDVAEGMNKFQNDNFISVYPNPAAEHLTIRNTKNCDKKTVQILNYSGQIQYENDDFQGDFIDIRQLSNGVYFLKYSDTKRFSVKNFLINH